jgi:ABC-type multidrug transport system ATPase subunit
MSAVVFEHITKTYDKGKVLAVNDVSFEVNKGELFGLIGADGAGKSTIFRILTTLLLPDSGRATVDGYDIIKDYKAIRGSVGYMPGRFSLYQDLTIEENLHFFATVFSTSIEENYDLIRDIYVQIEPFKKRRAGQLSGGMKQKLALCCALIHKPSVLFLDEPTTGVDSVSRKEFWEMLQRLKEQKITILVSTPYMDEAILCERIALIQEGQLLSIDTPSAIVRSFPSVLYAVKANNMYKLLKDIRAFEGVENCYAFGEHLHLIMRNGANAADLADLADYLASRGHEGLELRETMPTIEDCFIQLMPGGKQKV